MALPLRSVQDCKRKLDDLIDSNQLDQAFELLQRLDDDGYEWWIELQLQASRIPNSAWSTHPQLLIRRIVPLCWADRGEEASNLIALLERTAGQPGGLPVNKVDELRCVVLHTLGRYENAVQALEPLLDSPSSEVRSNAHNLMASCLCYLGRPIGEIEAHWTKCAEDALGAGNLKTRSAALFNLIWYVYVPQGRILETGRAIEALRQISNTKDKISQAWYRIPRALMAFDLGESGALRQLQAALGWAKRLQNPEAVETLTCLIADWHLRRGDTEKAAARIGSLRQASQPPASRIYVEAIKEACASSPQKAAFSRLLQSNAIPLYTLRAFLVAIRCASEQGWSEERALWLDQADLLAAHCLFACFGEATLLMRAAAQPTSSNEWFEKAQSERLVKCVAAAFPAQSSRVLQWLLEQDQDNDAARSLLAQIGYPVIRVQTFGELRVWLNGMELTRKGWQRNSAKQLFILLLLRDSRSIDVPSAAETLWPDSDGDFAQASLKVAESTLRKVLEPNQQARKRNRFLWREGDVIRLNLGNWALVDFIEAKRIVSAGDGERANEWALMLFGPFLQDLCSEVWAMPYIDLMTEIRRQVWRLALAYAKKTNQTDRARQLTLSFRSAEPENLEWIQP